MLTATASVTELREELSSYLDKLETQKSVMIVRHSKPAGFLVSNDLMEVIFECLEDLEDRRDAVEILQEIHSGSKTYSHNEAWEGTDV
ncbi:MAG: type II toxin-antitoxin system Phd/YefM family antitoxin [Chloroflexi bacterium]|nr:type II toxin-antitoxin system Phd/YefM family antitoxin [Chloroflexota bacterium]